MLPSGKEWNRSQPGQGATELGFPGPMLGQMQSKAAGRAGNPSRQTEEASSEGLGGHDLLTQADPRCPAGQVVGHHLYRQPSAVGGEAARGEMVQPDAVLEVSDGILDLGVAAVVGLQFEHLPVPVGDEAVIAVGGEEGQLGTGRGLHPPDDEPHRRGAGLALEGSVGGLGHVGGAVHPVGDRRPGIFGYRLDEIAQALVLADGDGEADIHPAADGDHAMSVEAAVGPHRELPPGPTVAHPPHRLPQEVGGAAGGVGASLAQPGHEHISGAGGDGQQRVIAPLAGVAVVSCPFLGQSVATLCPCSACAEVTNWCVGPRMYAHGEACRPDEDRADTGAYCPIRSMVREPYDGIIGDAPIGEIPLGRVATVCGALRRHAYTAMVEAVMSRGKSGAKPEGLSQLNLNAAGIDVGATSHFVAVPADRAEQPVREFEAFTADLYRLADWLAQCGVETVVMESTGVYWIPLFGVLEERGFLVVLVDPRRIKNVPGRKTDVLDCQWLQQLHTYGLLSGAFRPEGEIRRLRSYLRQRAMLVEYASHHVQHMQKALTQMNVKLQHVISDITGKTGMEIIEAIVGGQRDPVKLAQLRDPRIKADEATIAKSLRGHWREEHIFELTQALELYRFYHAKIAECDREIETHLERFEDRSTGGPPAAKSGRKRIKGNAPRFDVWTHLNRMMGVDLTRIDGVDAYTALKVISEIGTDMTKWPSAKHFASWLGLSPNNRITGGRVISSKTKPSANRAAAALRLAANALHRSDSALGAFLRRKKVQLGAPKAITATAHKLARLIYTMLRNGQEYVDAGAKYYERQYQQRALRAAKRRAAQLGYQLVPMSDAGDRTTYAPPGAPTAA